MHKFKYLFICPTLLFLGIVMVSGFPHPVYRAGESISFSSFSGRGAAFAYSKKDRDLSRSTSREKRGVWWSFSDLFRKKKQFEEEEESAGWIQTIFVDPGHGGTDNGANGISGLKEKDVTLAVARALAEKFRSSRLDIDVVLTRDDNYNVSLVERGSMANRAGADLFLSLHTNSFPRHHVEGMEIYFYDLEFHRLTDEDRKGRETDETEIEVSGNGEVEAVRWDEAQLPFQQESIRLAEGIDQALSQEAGIPLRGIHGAPVFLLQGIGMPAVLVELGFLSHAGEERNMAKKEWTEKVADALFKAIIEFDRESRITE